MTELFSRYREIWCLDFEFGETSEQRPAPRCLVATEVKTGRHIRMWLDGAGALPPPFDMGPSTLVVSYVAQAELRCLMAVGWPLPANILDLFAEFRCITNGLGNGGGLVDALAYFGESHVDLRIKNQMRDLALRHGAYSQKEVEGLLDYCATDVDALVNLMPHMIGGGEELDRALVRGRAVRAVAVTEDFGIPVNGRLLDRIRRQREHARRALANAAEQTLGLYDGTTFKTDRLETYVTQRRILWPRHPTGTLDLKRETFGQMADIYPELSPVHAIRCTMSLLSDFSLVATPSNRMRPSLWPFSAKTGRSQPRGGTHPFSAPKWLRVIIAPASGFVLIYVDWSQQEFGIGAALSGDEAMMRAYSASDPYITFGILAGLLPSWATKETHPRERARLKACALGILYGKTAFSLGRDLAIPVAEAEELIHAHRRAFSTFWRWSDSIVDSAMLWRDTHTGLGWNLLVGVDPNPRSLMNFPLQSTGAEMMRLALTFAVESGVRVCTTVHDAFLVEAVAGQEEAAAAAMTTAMAKASRVVLGGFELRAECQFVHYPNSMLDPEHRRMWDTVRGAIDANEEEDMR